MVQFLGAARDLSPLQRVQAGSAHPAPHVICTRCSFSSRKTARVYGWPLTFTWCSVASESSYISLP